MQPNDNRFPEQDEPNKLHGTIDETGQKEKYIRDSGKIEDLPEQPAKMSAGSETANVNEKTQLTDRSGEEKEEEYINTDERKKDIQKRS